MNIVQAILHPDLELFNKIIAKQFKTCKVETARFCRQGALNEAELRLLNQLLDRKMRGKPVALIPSQRTKRARNLRVKLMPRAVASFPVVSENVVRANLSNIELSNQFKEEMEKADLNLEKHVHTFETNTE